MGMHPVAFILVAASLVGCAPSGEDDSVEDDDIEEQCFETNDTCSIGTVCMQGECVDAFPNTYSAPAIHAFVSLQDLEGDGWDVNDGAPDLYAVVKLNGETVFTSAVVDNAPVLNNAFYAKFSLNLDFAFTGTEELKYEVFDSDDGNDRLVLGCSSKPISTFVLHERALRCEYRNTHVEMELQPQPRQ